MRTRLLLVMAVLFVVGWACASLLSSVDSENHTRVQKKYVSGSPLDRREIEQWVFQFTNEERARAGLRPLRHDTDIAAIALAHSVNMASRDVFNHVLDGDNANDRALQAGYDCRAYHPDGSYSYGLSENLAQYPRVTMWKGYYKILPWGSYSPTEYSRTAQDMARAIVQGLMDSLGHRKNILDPENRRIGIGVDVREESQYGYTTEEIYATQNFSSCS